MIDIPIFWQYQIILVVHYIADFRLQTHWQASNKSKNNVALLEHVAVYAVVMGVATMVLFGLTAMWFVFVWITAVTHFCTDYVTSRWSSKHFKQAIKDDRYVDRMIKIYGTMTANDLMQWNVKPGFYWHKFFEVIGLDQLIHQATLAATLWLIVQ